ncbi:hypothetical protein ACLK15_05280 [Escherichia coli]
MGKNFDIDELEALHQELEARIASLSDSVSNAREERIGTAPGAGNSCSLAFRV